MAKHVSIRKTRNPGVYFAGDFKKADAQSPCKKCAEVLDRMEQEDQLRLIDAIIVADERDPASEGMLLATELAVDRAPFFVVEHNDGSREVYTIYLKFVKEVLQAKTSKAEELKELLDNSADLDFL